MGRILAIQVAKDRELDQIVKVLKIKQHQNHPIIWDKLALCPLGKFLSHDLIEQLNQSQDIILILRTHTPKKVLEKILKYSQHQVHYFCYDSPGKIINSFQLFPMGYLTTAPIQNLVLTLALSNSIALVTDNYASNKRWKYLLKSSGLNQQLVKFYNEPLNKPVTHIFFDLENIHWSDLLNDFQITPECKIYLVRKRSLSLKFISCILKCLSIKASLSFYPNFTRGNLGY
jgi:hypothetical protein